MGNIVMGKDISTLSQDEKNALMAELRSRRHGTNGRAGYRTPESQRIKTNNFEDPSKKRKLGVFSKFFNEHVKCIFVCPRELIYRNNKCAKSKIYYIAFLSDSNRFSFEEFRESPPKASSEKIDGVKYRFKKYCLLFEKKNIDKDTDIFVCMDGMKDTDMMFCMLQFMRSFAGCPLKRVSKVDIIVKLINDYEIFSNASRDKERYKKYKDKGINKILESIYKFILDNKMCPWITEDTKKVLNALTSEKRRSRLLLEIGLFYSVLIKFERIRRESEKLNV